MCANYMPSQRRQLQEYFAVEPPAADYPDEAFPGYLAPLIRLAQDDPDTPDALLCNHACFGMVPPWADLKLAKSTYNARSETVATKPSFRHAWKRRQFCVIPTEAFFEPNYESGKAQRWRIADAEGRPLGIAGIWEWRPNGGPDDRPLESFSMLTINADRHPLMHRFHKPGTEKRMVVILDPENYLDWLQATAQEAEQFLQPYPAKRLAAEPAPRTANY